jgi:hypothetical protein
LIGWDCSVAHRSFLDCRSVQVYWRHEMMTRVLNRYALCSCVAGAMLVGCGALRQAQDDMQPAIGTPGAANDVQQAHSHRLIFSYTGSEQTFKVPTGVTLIKVAARGAGGGGAPNSYDQEGGRGGRVVAELPVTPGESLAIFVGGTADIISGGYNGGGNGNFLSTDVSSYGGGGATDIREGGTALEDRILVAGGGGGLGGAADGYGGGGGGGGSRVANKGDNGGGNVSRLCHAAGHGGGAGSQSSGGRGGRGAFGRACSAGTGAAGEFGVGGKGGGGDGGGGGGGGGGYYGGGGGGGGMYELDPKHFFGNGGGGGGGSSFIESTARNARNWKAWKDASGNGQIVISW